VLAVERVDAPPGPKTANLERAVGQRIEAVTRRGKFLLLPLRRMAAQPGGVEAPGDELVVHLGMTGVLSPRPPASHLRLRLRLDGPEPDVLYVQDARRFGRVLVVPGGDYRTLPTLAAMGPEPLSTAFTVAAFAAALARSTQPVKAYLLSQRPVSGVGNIYADEALWRARVHPQTPALALSRPRARALHAAIREVLAAAVDLQGTTLYDYRTVNGEVGAYLEKLDAYGHDGDPCPRCGTPIVRIVVGQRGTHLCPRCQRRAAPRRGGDGRSASGGAR
jgi:formamidopyrimidine-DNA glycosylase